MEEGTAQSLSFWRWRGRRRIALAVLAMAVVLAVLAGGMRALRRGRSPAPPAPPAMSGQPGERRGAGRGAANPVAPGSESGAPAASGREVLRGGVFRDGKPVVGALVTAVGAGKEVRSGEGGAFAIEGLARGFESIRALGEGAAAWIESVPVPDPAGAPLRIELHPALSVGGRVLDTDGHPIPGAEVALVEGARATLLRSTRSDAGGGFGFAAVLPGRYPLVARAPGFVAATLTVNVAARAPAPANITLERAASIAGEIVDDRGAPVAGAKVWFLRDGASALGGGAAGGARALVDPAGELGVVRGPVPYPPLDGQRPGGEPFSSSPSSPATDQRGRFRQGGLAPGPLTVVVSHPDFVDGRAEAALVAGGPEAAVRIALQRVIALHGRVVDGAGVPMPGAELWIDGALAAIADARGRWQLRRAPGAFEVDVRARGRTRVLHRLDTASAADDIELTVGGAEARLSGVVVDARGFPVAGARVLVEGADGASQTVSSDALGGFVLASAPAGPLTVRVSHREHPRATLAGIDPGDDVRVTLASGGVVEGEVVSERGGVASGARLTIEDADGERHIAAIDRLGRFRVTGCAPGKATLHAEAAGYLPAHDTLELPPADRSRDVVLRDVRVTLAEAGLVTGTVRDRWAQPVAGVPVEGGGVTARTDGAGRFRLSPVPPGRVEVVARTAQGEAADSVSVERGRASTIELRIR